MQEYKRDRNTLEAQLQDLTKRATYHDDLLRVLDAWFSQVSKHETLTVAQLTG